MPHLTSDHDHDVDHDDRTREERLHETRQNLRSIDHVPVGILEADSPARILLTAAASLALDVYCYASGGERTGTWCAWVLNNRIPLDTESGRNTATVYALLAVTRAVNQIIAASHSQESQHQSQSQSQSQSQQEGGARE